MNFTITIGNETVFNLPDSVTYVNASASDSCTCEKRVQRSCASCLDSFLENNESCVVTPLGLCVDATTVITQLDNNTSYHWASNKNYCSTGDAVCQECRWRWMDAYRSGERSSLVDSMCIGERGCVCTALCELREYHVVPPVDMAFNADAGQCGGAATPSVAPQWVSSYNENVALMRNITFLLCGAILVILTVRSSVAQFHQRRYDRRMIMQRQARREQRDAATQERPVLELAGWKSYREALIESEQTHLGIQPDALALSGSPARAVVEEGDGYRPGSPSQHAERHPETDTPRV